MKTPGAHTRPWAVRIYGALLRLMPADFRRSFAADAEDTFLDLYREAVSFGSRRAVAALWIRAVRGLVYCAVEARFEGRRQRKRGLLGPDGLGEGRGGIMSGVFQDLRYTIRGLARRPGFTFPAAAILAVGIGATTTIFSVVDTVVLRPLPYPDAERLVNFAEGAHSFPSLSAWQELASFELVAGARTYSVDLTGDGLPEQLDAAAVSSEFFPLLGGAPQLGRLFDSSDRAVAVLSHGTWERRWGGDPNVVGSSITLDGSPVVVVGVMRQDFTPPELATGSRVDLWLPLGDGGEWAQEHGFLDLSVLGRLRPGVSLEAAQGELDAQRTAVAELMPDMYKNSDGSLWMVPLVPMREATVHRVSVTLYLLLGAVGMMLLIACADVANLFLARGTSRTREVALRSALGASRARISGQVLMESLVLAAVGGALGVALAYGGVEVFTRFDPGGIPRLSGLEVDPRILLFSAAVSVGTGVLFGSLPAYQAARADVNETMKAGTASLTSGPGGRRMRNALVVTEIALALVLVTGAGLLFRTFVAMVSVDPGFDVEQLAVLPVDVSARFTEAERAQFLQDLTGRVSDIPGVTAVAGAGALPFKFTGGARCCRRRVAVGDPALADDERPFRPMIHPVTQGYFATLGAAVSSGREFERSEMERGAPVAILNRVTAERLYGTDDVVGRTLLLGGEETFTVIGVADGVYHWGMTAGVEPAIYVPFAQYGDFFPVVELAVRFDADLEALVPALQQAVWSVAPDLPVEVTTMELRVSASMASTRFLSLLFGAFAGLALLLATAGIYSSMLYTVGQRNREMGIRLAVGGEGRDVVKLIMVHGLILCGGGTALGALGALLLSRLMERLIWGVEATDPATLAGTVLLLGGSALSACVLPAWKGARADPLETLRAD